MSVSPTASSPPPRYGLATRLLAGQGIVLLAGAVTTGLVAALIGPPIFYAHLFQSGRPVDSPALGHIGLAFRDASLISLVVGLLISLVAATAVTWFLTRRLRRPLDQITTAARELALGHYSTRVPDVGSGTELDTLAEAFNTMAARLEGVETTRRRLLSDLAHELRTPIATLTVYHDGLHDKVTELGPESRAVLAEQTARLTRLADDIDEVSTAEEGRLGLDRHAHSVDDLLWAAHDAIAERYADKGVRLVLDPVTPAGMRVSVDRHRIGQVLANLLTNSLRHTPPGGTVILAAHRAGQMVVLTVADTGDGIEPGQLGQIFERFYRGDAARTRDSSGAGIGLTISKAIADAHGGTLTATSPGVGRGATFLLTLPLERR